MPALMYLHNMEKISDMNTLEIFRIWGNSFLELLKLVTIERHFDYHSLQLLT